MTTSDRAPLPHQELDRSLAPIRRVLAWTLEGGPQRAGQLKYFEVIAGRSLSRAAALDLPQDVREQIAVLGGRLSGFDSLDAQGRWERIGLLYPMLWRLDDVLGLPLEPIAVSLPAPEEESGKRARTKSKSRSKSRSRSRRESDDGSDKKTRRTSRRKSGRGSRSEPAPEPPEEKTSSRSRSSHRWGDPEHTGKPLVELDPDLAPVLAEAGLETVGDLLLLRPSGEERLRPVHGSGREIPAGRVAVGGRVRARATRLFPDGRRQHEVLLYGAGPMWARWTGAPEAPPIPTLDTQARVVLVGQYQPGEDEDAGVLLDAELGWDDGHHDVRLCTYDLDVPQPHLRALVRQCLDLVPGLRDHVPDSSLSRVGLPDLQTALTDAHLRGRAARKARQRLGLDEVLQFQLGQAWDRLHGGRERGMSHSMVHGMAASLCQLFDMELRDNQQRAFEDIKRDLMRPLPMQRLLTGEAGAGKGQVSLLSMITVAESKSQVVLTAADPVAAELRFLFIEPFLRELGLVGRLILGEPSSAQRDAVRRGEVHVLFGTHEILDQGLEFRRLGLVVSEEGEVFGRAHQRAAALRPRPDLLVVTSTPVPSQVLLTAYASFDITLMSASARRLEVDAQVYLAQQRAEAYERARTSLESGRQVLVVFPTVAGRDVIDLRQARHMVRTLGDDVFKDYRVALFHGGLSREERYRVYDDFRHHRSDVLVATTHFEDGPNLPGASVVVVEQADRMNGLRLHRVRDHLAQSSHPGECLLVVGEVPDESGQSWVEFVASTSDGLSLSIEDLRRRGLASLVPEGTTEPPTFSWFQPDTDLDLLLAARSEAHTLIEEDRGPSRGRAVDLIRRARSAWPAHTDAPCPLPSGGGRRRRRRKRR